MTEAQIIKMLSSPAQQCRIDRGRVQVRRHRASSTFEVYAERYWSEWITVAAAPPADRQGQDVSRRAS